jgi:hypothetical protein
MTAIKETITYGVTLVARNQVYVIHKEVDGDPYLGKPVKTPLGELRTVFCNKRAIGRMLDCPYLVSEVLILPRAKKYYLSTVCNQNIYVDEDICMFATGNYLIAGFAADYALDGDIAKET